MASWTQEEYEQVAAAVVALATGTRVVTISYAGPPARSVQYGQANLADLRALLAEMRQSLAGAIRFRRVEFSKGFQ